METTTNIQTEPKEDFNMGATIAVLTLLLGFIGSSFYVLVSSYMELI
mgnify:CR=1 FL=1